MAIEEVKIGCTLAMLVCLTRALRIAYLLGDVFELTDAEAADVLEIPPPAYRQRLRRARAVVKLRTSLALPAALFLQRPPAAATGASPRRSAAAGSRKAGLISASTAETVPISRPSAHASASSKGTAPPRRSCAPIPTSRPESATWS
jgi:hypothetical protein